MTMERTLVLVKPDGVQRGLAGEIIGRLERTGLQIVGMKLMQISDELAGTHYGEHKGKPFYDGLVGFITSSPVVALCLEGPSAIPTTRKLMGKQTLLLWPQTHSFKQKIDALGFLRLGHVAKTVHRFTHNVAGAQTRVERRIWVLKDELHLCPRLSQFFIT